MSFFEMPLAHRLFLAMIPSALFLLPPEYEDLMIYGYSALFGILVMAPFITSRYMLALRVAVLVATPVLVIFIVLLAIEGGLPAVFDIYPLFSMRGTSHDVASVAFDMLELALILSTLPALVLFVVGPLGVSGKYWTYTFLAGLVTAAGVFAWVEWFFCLVFCSRWSQVSIFLPFSVWSLSFCIAVYYGRISTGRPV